MRREPELSRELQSRCGHKAIEETPTDRLDRATVAQVFAQVLKPEPVGYKRWLRFDNDQIFGPPARSHLEHET